jgi:type IV secretion system protein VirB11
MSAARKQRPFPFLDLALEPLKPWLSEDRVTEISINRPGEVFVERLGAVSMQRYEVPTLTADRIRHLAERVASATEQSVNSETPLLSAALPTGERFQAILPPAAPDGGAISIRRQVVRDLTLDDYESSGSLGFVRVASDLGLSEDEKTLVQLLSGRHIKDFLRCAVGARVSIIVSGGTTSGKTTLLNALLKEIPSHERIITIEDTPELRPPNPNALKLVASKNDQGIAQVDLQKLVEASLRMRPDRLLLGELRGVEAFSFLRAVNTGHPGSLTTVHADSPRGAYEALALMVMQSGVKLSKDEILAYLRAVIPIVVQLGRRDGRRVVTDILYARAHDRGL